MVSDNYIIDSIDESEDILKDINSGKIETIKTLGISGLGNLTKTINISNKIDFHELDLPSCVLSDLAEWSPFFKDGNIIDLSCDDIFNSLYPHESKVKIFSAACNI